MSIDVQQVTDAVIATASEVIDADVTLIRSFQRRQVEALAQQAAFIAAGIASGDITENTRDFFLDELEHMAESFVKTLVRLSHVLFEKIWNAVMQVLWQAIEGAIGTALPLPRLA
ncbi:hypothetical protein [Thiocapsa roseopersicina]|uniref:Uncharacterized protein n=1 Tax=Thiocapsa roseopersicina TaxID=1058 RepID=A0A1H3B7B1_THIRO|nr:hypothetical protein [Thiocapsa roseopersicina]SDX37793.1 hypothetical protein SAMN05421783_12331 [Thiocapsa roseopersicina]